MKDFSMAMENVMSPFEVKEIIVLSFSFCSFIVKYPLLLHLDLS